MAKDGATDFPGDEKSDHDLHKACEIFALVICILATNLHFARESILWSNQLAHEVPHINPGLRKHLSKVSKAAAFKSDVSFHFLIICC